MESVFEYPSEEGYLHLNVPERFKGKYNYDARMSYEDVVLPKDIIDEYIRIINKGFEVLRNDRNEMYENLMIELSGGVDSSLALMFALESVPKDNIIVVRYKNRDNELETEKEDDYYAEMLIERYGLKERVLRVELEDVLGFYEREILEKDNLESRYKVEYCDAVVWARTVYTRMLEIRHNALKIDTACLTEDMYGAFTTGAGRGHFGLTEYLLKSEVRKVARDIGLPKEMYERRKVSGEVGSSFISTWGVDESVLDLIAIGYIYGPEKELSRFISKSLGHDYGLVKYIVDKMDMIALTRYNTGEPTIKLSAFYKNGFDVRNSPLNYRGVFNNSDYVFIKELERCRKRYTSKFFGWDVEKS